MKQNEKSSIRILMQGIEAKPKWAVLAERERAIRTIDGLADLIKGVADQYADLIQNNHS